MDSRKWARGISFTAGVAAGVSAVYYGAARMLTDIAFNRKMPTSAAWVSDRISGSPKLREIFTAQKEAARVLNECACETVQIQSHDGLTLTGHLRRTEEPERLIIAFHGWRSTWAMDFGAIAPFWQENHCNVLYVEQRGQNESGGDYMGFGLLERYDCLNWVRWAEEQNFGLPIYLSGISMGATTVLMAAGMGMPECVHGISADCGFTSPHAIWKHIAQDNLHLRYTPMRKKLVDEMCRRKIHVKPDEYSTVEAMAECHTPILFVHGAEDKFVPVEMTYENYNACRAPKQLVIVPGAEHGMSYLVDKEGCEKVLLEFYKTYDEKKVGEE